jgi:glutathione S-transferase
MLTLLTFPSGLDQFSLSPFCVKAACFLQMSGQPWDRQDLTDLSEMPHQKLPVLKAGKDLVADSEAIRVWLERKGADFDPGLSDVQKAFSRALIRMADEHLYFHLLMDRWGNDDAWPAFRDVVFQGIPSPMRQTVADEVRTALLSGLQTQGVARFSQPQRGAALEQDFRALAAILSRMPFLFGDSPTAADLSVAPVLEAMRATPVRTALVKRVANDNVLTDYLTRMTQTVPLP